MLIDIMLIGNATLSSIAVTDAGKGITVNHYPLFYLGENPRDICDGLSNPTEICT